MDFLKFLARMCLIITLGLALGLPLARIFIKWNYHYNVDKCLELGHIGYEESDGNCVASFETYGDTK